MKEIILNSIGVPYKYQYIIILLVILFFCVLLLEVGKHKNHKKNKGMIESEDRENKEIERLREKFKYDLVGRWSSCQGTFTAVMNEVWIFYSDGNGITIDQSAWSGEKKEEFRWRRKDLFCIEICYFEVDEADTWIEINYDFCKVPTDCGFVIALVQLDKGKKARRGFGLMEVPLTYESDVY